LGTRGEPVRSEELTVTNVFETLMERVDDAGLDLRVGQRINDRRDVAGLRSRVRQVVGDTWLEPRIDAVALVATELAANGLVHGAQPVLFRLLTGPERVVITVFDGGDASPYFDPDADASIHASAGRGLHLVSASADRCGTRKGPDGGKWVFAEWRRARDGGAA
jgi:anti-sigma regulatory factor (Ser/Thr protein kinase)